MERMLIVYNAQKPGARECLGHVCPWVQKRLRTDLVELDDPAVRERLAAADLVVVLGGDGSILRVARLLGGREVPVVGINLGKLGYLADFTAEEFCDRFGDIVAGHAPISRRRMLAVHWETAAAHDGECVALNDVYLTGGQSHRMVAVRAAIDGRDLTTYVGDGVVVSTPTGSTAYGLAAGGPILLPDLDALVLVPVCPHSLTHRPIVIQPDSEVLLVPVDLQKEAVCVVDGQEVVRLQEGDPVRIRGAKTGFLLVQSGRRADFALLREKLHWGQALRYKSK
jgi:NAD+ kinase